MVTAPRYTIRPTREADTGAVMAMYDHSRRLMRADGNTTQWVGYPTLDQLRLDMQRGTSYVIVDADSTLGTFALVPGAEPTYGYIEHGRWIDDTTPYATLHRLAKREGTAGIAAAAFAYAQQRYPHLRIDTHETNHAMRHLVGRSGFVECGTVYMGDGTPRLAYEWWRWDTVPAGLRRWVESEVLPRYARFDAAHREDHARRVIARAMCMQAAPTVYTAAAMHDLGLAEGREQHHLASGRIIRNCSQLRQWFTEEEIELIAQAAEDHRASATTPPRSALGCIIAEADRDVEPERIVRRTVEYGLSHYPQLDREGHWQRTQDHLHEKYAAGGYIQLWLADSPNAAPLAELRTLIDDTPRLRHLFDHLFSTLSPNPLNPKP